jgi:hypothetical protein
MSKSYSKPDVWSKEISKIARKASITPKYILSCIIMLFLFGMGTRNFVVGVTGPFPHNIVSTILSALGPYLGILISLKLLPAYSDSYIPQYCHYRKAAFEIINSHVEKNFIAEQKAQQLREIATKYLGAVEQKGSQAKAKKLLNEACKKLAEVY